MKTQSKMIEEFHTNQSIDMLSIQKYGIVIIHICGQERH